MTYAFFNDDTGAVTVDWVVLTAGLVGLGLAVMTVVSSGVQDLSTDVDETLSTQIISTSFPDIVPPVPTRGAQVGSSAWNNSAGPSIVSQTNCQHFEMSNDEVWKSCVTKNTSGVTIDEYWTTGDGSRHEGEDPVPA